jgi:hypothetical protein
LYQSHFLTSAHSQQRSRSLAERPLREWPIQERPIERLLECGPAALSESELLAVVLNGSAGGANPVALAQQLISTFGAWQGLHQASQEEIQRIPGVGRTRAAQIKAVLEIARRLLQAQPNQIAQRYRDRAACRDEPSRPGTAADGVAGHEESRPDNPHRLHWLLERLDGTSWRAVQRGDSP